MKVRRRALIAVLGDHRRRGRSFSVLDAGIRCGGIDVDDVSLVGVRAGVGGGVRAGVRAGVGIRLDVRVGVSRICAAGALGLGGL
ncbi:hypothetical protein C6A85_83640 [Mycobacterium sp. ITM-2017-0098]|nr:hypothetical protein C6A85_83640 [Mycobacterium sp. ITM-2017-0098]